MADLRTDFTKKLDEPIPEPPEIKEAQIRQAPELTLWQKFKESITPGIDPAKATQAIIDSESLGISPSEAYDYQDSIKGLDKTDPRLRNLRLSGEERVMKRWDAGVSHGKQGLVEWNMMFTDDPELFNELELASDKLVAGITRPLHKGIFEKAIGATAEMLPIMVQGSKEGLEKGLKLGAGAAAITAAAGQAGPQVLTPEEIITVPIAFGSMFSVGFTEGSLENIMKVEAGLAYREVRTLTDAEGNKIDPNIARAAAFGVGAINSLIEVAQIRTLLKTIPGAEKIFQKTVRETVIDLLQNQTVKGIAMKYLKKHGAFIAKETAQEVAQESVNIFATELSKNLNNELKGTGFEPATVGEITARIAETAKESALSFAVLGVPGHAVGVAKDTGVFKELVEGEAGAIFPEGKGKKPLSEFPTIEEAPEIKPILAKLEAGDVTGLEELKALADERGADIYAIAGNNLKGTEEFAKIKDQYEAQSSEAFAAEEVKVEEEGAEIGFEEGIEQVIRTGKNITSVKFDAQKHSLKDFIAIIGGLNKAKEQDGGLTGELDTIKEEGAGRFLVNNESGLSVDDARMQAIEEGFIDEFASPSEFLEALKEDLNATESLEKVWSSQKDIETEIQKANDELFELEEGGKDKKEVAKLKDRIAKMKTGLKERKAVIESRAKEKAQKGIAKEKEKSAKKIAKAETKMERKMMKSEAQLATKLAKMEAQVIVTKESEKAKTEKKIAQIRTEKEVMTRRRKKIRSIRDTLGLTDAQMRKVSRKDPRLMSNFEFKKYADDLYNKAVEFQETAKAKAEVMALIQDRQFKKHDNMRKALKLPAIEKMTKEQAIQFYDALEPFEQGDVFLSQRKLELVDRTDFVGIKTLREALEKTSEKLGVPIEEVKGTVVSEFERFKPDTQLAKVNPVFHYIVQKMVMKDLQAQTQILKAEEEVDVLAKKARASRKKTLSESAWEFIAPQDRNVFAYIEANEETRKVLIKEMTPGEIDYANYINNKMSEHLEYLMSIEALKKSRFEEAYINHLRKGLLETVKDKGLRAGIENLFAKYKHDEQIANILDTATGDVLPLEKFIPNVLFRAGEIDPTQNVAKAFLQYNSNIEKKKALDSTLTELDIIVHALEPEVKTPRGLKLDKSLDRFFKEYVNTKKGRHTRAFVKQGGKLDITLRALRSFTAIKDLGGNIIVGFTARLGEASGNFIQLGHKNFAKGLMRKRTDKGKAIVNKYKNFIGKSIWGELSEVTKDGGDKIAGALFGLFHHGMVSANKTFLLGSMTDAEYRSGEISDERLAQLKLDMGEYRIVVGSSSVAGATPEAATELQYKRWAVPMLQSTYNNIKTLAKKKELNSKEAWQLYRSLETVLAISILGSYVVDEDDDTFLGRARQKVFRELMSIYGALDASFWANQARVISFASNILIGLKQLMTLEEYEKSSSKWGYRKGELKGARRLQKELVPRALTQFNDEDKGSKKKRSLKQVK